jgi:16S rRNA (cytidine1402-2'-O)-methyltransferase
MFFLVSTPIGNLEDITLRAIKTLKEVETILCEDTRHSLPLLRHFGISTKVESYHKFNEEKNLPSLLARLKKGEKIALISDAGTPGIADPGERLVAECRKEGIEVVPIPGACAPIAALVASGLPTTRFQWVGFLPKKKGELETALKDYLDYRGTTVIFETPHRIIDTLEMLLELAPKRQLVVARELTKKFETFVTGKAEELLAAFKTPPRGEIVLLLSPKEEEEKEPPEALLKELLQEKGLRVKEVVEIAHQMTGYPKKVLYKIALELQ